MAFDAAAAVKAVQAVLEESQLFKSVVIAQPLTPLGEGPSCAIRVESMRIVALTLNSAIELHTVKVRLIRARFSQGEEARELDSAGLASQVMDLLYGQKTLGGRVRNIDYGGQYSQGVEIQWTESDTALSPEHVADIMLPILVDSDTRITG